MSELDMDAYVSRLQNMPSWNIHSLDNEGSTTFPWFQVPHDIWRALVINELNAQAEAMTIGAEIQKWGRLTALARRIWQVEERGYRSWRSAFLLDAMNPDGKPDGWKKPTKDQVESAYRVDPDYKLWQVRIERAEEAYHATECMVDALRAKKDALIRFAPTWRDAGAATAV
ncbi:MAG: hypothetical protein JSU89_15800 [Myxococcales bacterium]|nr:MAG: hypothetical protein JSU89_15800 [Myxococcales bacterium]